MAEVTRSIYAAGHELIPGYHLVKPLGDGASGSVWEVYGQGKSLALKIVDLKRRIGRRELLALQRVKDINHPNLVPIFAIWFKDSHGTLVSHADLFDERAQTTTNPTDGDALEAVELLILMGLGETTLAGRLREYRGQGYAGIPREELLDHLESAARALDCLNRDHGIQHSDVKPSNILIVGGGTQVCDFGLAKAMGEDIRQTSAACSPAYAAPEVLEHAATGRSDQYSLAVCYVELATGRLPFPSSQSGLLAAKLRGQLNLEELSESDGRIISRNGSRARRSVQSLRRYDSRPAADR